MDANDGEAMDVEVLRPEDREGDLGVTDTAEGGDEGRADVSRCSEGLSLCSGMCVDLQESERDCGACGRVCEPVSNALSRCLRGVCVYGGCAPGFADCDGLIANGCEVNLATSAAHCGACGGLCAPARASGLCRDGNCGIGVCSPGFADCDGDSANGCEAATGTGVLHCGGCGRACVTANGAPVCRAGVCGTGVCDRGFEDCDGESSNGCETVIFGDLDNCGRCRNVCPRPPTGSAVCAEGGCRVSVCMAGRADCDGAAGNGCETDIATVDSCGGCGRRCVSPMHASAVCVAGVCAMGACEPGWADCDSNPGNGCEVDTRVSGLSCGGCGRLCAPARGVGACVSGVCALRSCEAGFADCDRDPVNGCEVNLATSEAHCGGCGRLCAPPRAAGRCVGGMCLVGSCEAGFADCDGDPRNGCEVSVTTDVRHCGVCRRECPVPMAGTAVCLGGLCGQSLCAPGFGNCDGNDGNGCEARLGTDRNHCGGCGALCGAQNSLATCVSGVCRVMCDMGFGDCNGVTSDGCEAALQFDNNHCSACGNVCGIGRSCIMGVCACDPTRTLCAGSCVNLGTDPSNCGSCGGLCDPGDTCSGGVCSGSGSVCSGGRTCNGFPVDTCVNPSHCGVCGLSCAATSVCMAGMCVPCPPGRSRCSNTCTNLSTDPSNCGACGVMCTSGTFCAAGGCRPVMPDPADAGADAITDAGMEAGPLPS